MKFAEKMKNPLWIMLLLTAGNLLGKGLGFLRDVLISNYYGVSSQTDAFFLAISIPTIIIGIFTNSTDSAIVPQYARISENSGGRKAADSFFSNVINILTVLVGIVTIVMLLMPEKILYLFAPQFDVEQRSMAAAFLRIAAPMGLFHIFYCFFVAYLLCYQKTGVRVILSFSTNIIVVLTLLLFHDDSMQNIAWAYLFSGLVTALLPMIGSCRNGYRHRMVLSVKNYEFPTFFKFFLPVMGSALLEDLLLYSDRFLSSFLETGSLSLLNYASKIINIFDNILVVGVGAVILPLLTRIHLKKEYEDFREIISSICFISVLFLLPIAISCIFYAQEAIEVIYYRGAFTQEDVRKTSVVLIGYGLQILLLPMHFILIKTLHSMQNTALPFRISCITCILNIVFSIIMMQYLAAAGIALGTTASTLAGCILLVAVLRQKIGFELRLFSPRNLLKLLLCLIPLWGCFLFVSGTAFSAIQKLLCGGAAALVFYCLAAIFFRRELKELKTVLDKNQK